jgi:hypothetical protein
MLCVTPRELITSDVLEGTAYLGCHCRGCILSWFELCGAYQTAAYQIQAIVRVKECGQRGVHCSCCSSDAADTAASGGGCRLDAAATDDAHKAIKLAAARCWWEGSDRGGC